MGVDHGHDAVFFALQYLLFLRAEALHHITCVARLTQYPSLYDLQDVDPAELGPSIDWAIQAASELASSTKTAEQCAALLNDSYQKFITAFREAPQRTAQLAAQLRAAHAAALGQWRDRRDFWRLAAQAAAAVGLVGWAGFLILINR